MEEDKPELLPQTPTDLDTFVQSLKTKYSLPDEDDTYDAIATAILHYKQDEAYVKPSYFANKVRKMIANRAAYMKCMEFKDKRDALDKQKEQEEKKKTELSLVKGNTSDNGVTVQDA